MRYSRYSLWLGTTAQQTSQGCPSGARCKRPAESAEDGRSGEKEKTALVRHVLTGICCSRGPSDHCHRSDFTALQMVLEMYACHDIYRSQGRPKWTRYDSIVNTTTPSPPVKGSRVYSYSSGIHDFEIKEPLSSPAISPCHGVVKDHLNPKLLHGRSLHCRARHDRRTVGYDGDYRILNPHSPLVQQVPNHKRDQPRSSNNGRPKSSSISISIF